MAVKDAVLEDEIAARAWRSRGESLEELAQLEEEMRRAVRPDAGR
jgi:hypothetical protein